MAEKDNAPPGAVLIDTAGALVYTLNDEDRAELERLANAVEILEQRLALLEDGRDVKTERLSTPAPVRLGNGCCSECGSAVGHFDGCSQFPREVGEMYARRAAEAAANDARTAFEVVNG